MSEPDPHDEEPPYTFECMDCGYRTEADHTPGECPKCGGEMENISRARES
ncbi:MULTISPECIES: rubrerythrin-like domain-containing protein [Halorussus]|nr:rubrerythrin-like domain-containing protein [Halorussus vallis]USZ74253.1 rubrerythrin-like domain-containing protein [Halorussus vallis]